MSALAVTALEGAPNDGAHAKTFWLVGGNDQLPKAFAAKLADNVKYNTEVLKLAHDANGVSVTVRDAAGQHVIDADHCVCTLPFPLLRRIQITPVFSTQKMEAIRQYDLVDLVVRVRCRRKRASGRMNPLGALGGLNMIGTDTSAWDAFGTPAYCSPIRSEACCMPTWSIARQATSLGFPARERLAHCVQVVSTFLPHWPQS